MTNIRLNRERTRLHFAFQKATDDNAKGNKYKSRVEKAPMLIYNNGLGNTLAFIHANKKDKGGWDQLYAHIYEWLQQHYPLTKGRLGDPQEMVQDLLDDSKFPEAAYRAITHEVLKLLEGLKRFAVEEKANDDTGAQNEGA